MTYDGIGGIPAAWHQIIALRGPVLDLADAPHTAVAAQGAPT